MLFFEGTVGVPRGTEPEPRRSYATGLKRRNRVELGPTTPTSPTPSSPGLPDLTNPGLMRQVEQRR